MSNGEGSRLVVALVIQCLGWLLEGNCLLKARSGSSGVAHLVCKVLRISTAGSQSPAPKLAHLNHLFSTTVVGSLFSASLLSDLVGFIHIFSILSEGGNSGKKMLLVLEGAVGILG